MNENVNPDVNENEDAEDEEEDEIRLAFDESIEDETNTEDDIKMAMIQAGATFKNVGSLYNSFMIDIGKAMSRKDRTELVEAAVEDVDLETEEGFDAAVGEIVENGVGISARDAASMIRRYAKKNEIECFKKSVGGGRGAWGFKSAFYEFLEKNPKATEEDIDGLLKTHPSASDNTRKRRPNYQRIRLMANRIAGVA